MVGLQVLCCVALRYAPLELESPVTVMSCWIGQSWSRAVTRILATMLGGGVCEMMLIWYSGVGRRTEQLRLAEWATVQAVREVALVGNEVSGAGEKGRKAY